MPARWILIACTSLLAEAGCKTVDCADGTVERDGRCEPADQTVGTAACGPFTELQGDTCVPMFPPTVCDPATTIADVDPATGVTTCIGTGAGGCSAPFPCPTPATGKQTICGQLYDFETGAVFQGTNPTGMACPATPTADGPCALGINAYDAIEFASNPSAAQPLATADVHIDDCGRYRLTDVTPGASPFIGLGIDDAAPADRGPGGVTNVVGVTTARVPDAATRGLEGFIARASTTTMWAQSSGVTIATGYYAMVFRAASTGVAHQAGVTALRMTSPIPNDDYYFQAAQAARQTIDPAAVVTGANGTALITSASLADQFYTGTGGLPAECRWSARPGVTLPGIVFISIFRPENAPGQTCPL